MLPFFARPLPRREMALGCAVLSLALLLSTLPAALRWGQAQLDTGALLCADTLRFHIRADSDSPADQTVKLAVRDAVLAYADARCTAQDKPAALRWAAENLPALELTARAVLARRGIFSTVTVQLVEMYFDTTRYSTGILPAGRYQALRIDLGGNARHGKNWWCVLYPGLCRSACGTYALPEENDLVCGSYVVRFKCVEWWQRVTASREDKVLVETASPSQALRASSPKGRAFAIQKAGRTGGQVCVSRILFFFAQSAVPERPALRAGKAEQTISRFLFLINRRMEWRNRISAKRVAGISSEESEELQLDLTNLAVTTGYHSLS